MKTVLEGIVLHAYPQGENHLIAPILLRSGKRLATLFYNGKGGKNFMNQSKRGSGKIFSPPIGLGQFLQMELTFSSRTSLAHTSQWNPQFYPQNIRHNVEAFSWHSLMSEILLKLSPEFSLSDHQELKDPYKQNNEFSGLFRVLSNGIFYLDEALKDKKFHLQSHITLFLGKLVWELGFAPKLDSCIKCLTSFREIPPQKLFHKEGGFLCQNCHIGILGSQFNTDLEVFRIIQQSMHTPYKLYDTLPPPSTKATETLFHYFCFQGGIDSARFKSLKSLNLNLEKSYF
jgi:recombinational DNA repair protein (RecF pathway)